MLLRLGLPWELTTAALRAGGATYWFQSGIEPGRLKFWGRWASERTLSHYLQEAVSALMVLKLDAAHTMRLERMLAAGAKLAFPPPIARTQVIAKVERP